MSLTMQGYKRAVRLAQCVRAGASLAPEQPFAQARYRIVILENDVALFFLETLTCELQCPTVLGHRTHDMVRCAGRNFRIDFDRHRRRRTDQPGKMRNDFIGLQRQSDFYKFFLRHEFSFCPATASKC